MRKEPEIPNPPVSIKQGLPKGTVTFLFTDIEGSTKKAPAKTGME
jgi:class 3 adenylate cyclase